VYILVTPFSLVGWTTMRFTRREGYHNLRIAPIVVFESMDAPISLLSKKLWQHCQHAYLSDNRAALAGTDRLLNP
jgi:hypothetical protein